MITREDKFWSCVDKHGPKVRKYVLKHYPELKGTRCWLWTGHIDKNGYGLFKGFGKLVRAHRQAYVLKFGKSTLKNKKWRVCHKCDMSTCVNWSHLFRGTSIDNNRDCVRKDHNLCGTRHWTHVYPERIARGNRHRLITPERARKIRRLYASGEYTQKELATKFDVTYSTISAIILRKRWKDA